VELYLYSPNTPSWRGVQLKHRENFTFNFYGQDAFCNNCSSIFCDCVRNNCCVYPLRLNISLLYTFIQIFVICIKQTSVFIKCETLLATRCRDSDTSSLNFILFSTLSYRLFYVLSHSHVFQLCVLCLW
jgi:hypothetical protein